MEDLSPERFIEKLTYLPFDEVVGICQSNNLFQEYCSDKYKHLWKRLVENTFGDNFDYHEKLKEVQEKVGTDYNYLVYVHMVKTLDPLTQAMIYFRQGDMNSFETFSDGVQSLALFILDRNDILQEKFPDSVAATFNYRPNGFRALYRLMVRHNNIRGIEKMISMGAELNKLLFWAIEYSPIRIVEYLVKRGADIRYNNELPLREAIFTGRLAIIKYLILKGADFNQRVKDNGLVRVIERGILYMVDFLVRNGANVNFHNDEPIQLAIQVNNLDIVKYLMDKGANIHVALATAEAENRQEILDYLRTLYNIRYNA